MTVNSQDMTVNSLNMPACFVANSVFRLRPMNKPNTKRHGSTTRPAKRAGRLTVKPRTLFSRRRPANKKSAAGSSHPRFLDIGLPVIDAAYETFQRRLQITKPVVEVKIAQIVTELASETPQDLNEH